MFSEWSVDIRKYNEEKGVTVSKYVTQGGRAIEQIKRKLLMQAIKITLFSKKGESWSITNLNKLKRNQMAVRNDIILESIRKVFLTCPFEKRE